MTASLPRLAFGGDYNPEQWPTSVQIEDVELMQEAGVDLVTLGVFSWALLEPSEGTFTFDWLDEVMERLHAGGIRVDLATATASPPPWLAARHPETLPVTADGRTLWPGGRQAFCPSSPVYRERAQALCRAMAERYGSHDALALWHVGNELGGHNALCYCDVSAAAFRVWLEKRYGDIDRLNDAWGTAFWSQHYASFEEVLPPRSAPTFPNPTQQLDFRRFSSDELLANFVAERDILHELSPGVPVTTNFMVMQHVREMDYWAWAREVDVVSNDHYLTAADPDGHIELAFSADLTRGLAGGRPWLLMEHSTSAVNWQPRNVAKRPGEMRRTSLQHVARGADAVLFFQWRASRAGAEKFHSGLVPHAGTDTRLWREVVELSRTLDQIEEVAGSGARNRVAMLFDWECWWATELDSHPTQDLTYLDRAHAFYRALWERGVGVDFVHPEQDLAGYDLVVVPTLYAVTDLAAERVRTAVEAGATALVTYFSGIVDENDHIRLGGYPGAFRDLLGISVEEFAPLREGDRVRLSDGTSADLWTEHVHLRGAESLATYVDGPLPGVPALTRHRHGAGTAWYSACRLDGAGTAALVDRLLKTAGVAPAPATLPGVEVVRRSAADGRSWLFVINHTAATATVEVRGHDLVSDRPVQGLLELPAGDVAVVREE
ncbi:MAG TPA: beta-galactosidase [Nocardioidaceae bacterium]|nr:beta-galactosidase [Nocardioidaceae bacterium]